MSDERDQMIQKVSDQMEKVADTVDSMKDCIMKLDKKQDLHIQKMEYELKGIKKLDRQQNAILEDHVTRSTALQRDNELRETALRAELAVQKKRIESLEQPRKWRKTTMKGIVWVGSTAGALYAILRLLNIF